MPKQALRGVNLGGWLVLEPWITPSLFADTDALDEFTYCDTAGQKQFQKLSQHRKTFITRKDFQWLAEQDIQAVRIPVGYWIFGDQPPYVGAIDYLDRAFKWAEEAGLRVLLCLHGAPGSQNGEVHSGRQGSVEWPNNPDNIALSLKIIERLAERYASHHALLGIELLNEPAVTIASSLLKDYYKQGYRLIRRICGRRAWVVFSDSFQLRRWAWNLHWPFHTAAYIDTHQYQIYTADDKALSLTGHLTKTRRIARILRRIRRHRRIIVGEWSVALDSQSLQSLSGQDVAEAYKRYLAAQIKAYDATDAWFYWTYKTEDDGPWSFRTVWQSYATPR